MNLSWRRKCYNVGKHDSNNNYIYWKRSGSFLFSEKVRRIDTHYNYDDILYIVYFWILGKFESRALFCMCFIHNTICSVCFSSYTYKIVYAYITMFHISLCNHFSDSLCHFGLFELWKISGRMG